MSNSFVPFILALVVLIILVFVFLGLLGFYKKIILQNNENFEETPIICIAIPTNTGLSKRVVKQYSDLYTYDLEETDSILDLLNTGLYDFVFWMNDKVIFNDFDKSIFSILKDDKDIFICKNKEGDLDKNVMIIKNTEWAKNVIASGNIPNDPTRMYIGEPYEFSGNRNSPSDFIHDYTGQSDDSILVWINNHKELFPLYTCSNINENEL